MDACLLSLATIEEIEASRLVVPYLEVILNEEAFAAYKTKTNSYLYNDHNVTKPFKAHLNKLSEYIQSREEPLKVTNRIEKIRVPR